MAQQAAPPIRRKPTPQAVASRVLGDQPAATVQEDRLGFKPYVDAVAKFLTAPSTRIPLTLSVEGLWGSGKSSFMLQLQQALRQLGCARIVSFNAWQYNADEGLWAAFIHEFDETLNSELKLKDKIRVRLRLLRLRLSWQDSIDNLKALLWLIASAFAFTAILWFFLHGGIHALEGYLAQGGEPAKAAGKTVALVGGTGGAVAAILLFLNQVKDLFKSPASLEKTAHLFSRQSYAAKLPLIHEVTRDFNSLVSAYAGNDSVYVFIDDLDRCEYTKAAELMQALLMLLSSAPKIALIVGLDRDKVAAAMAAKQEKLLPYLYKIPPAEIYSLGMTYGQRFLEKFIQIAYILPAPRLNGLRAMINPNAKAPVTQVPDSQKSPATIELITGEDDSETLDRIIEMGDLVFDHNPRNIKQFINMFRLQAFIANETGLFGYLSPAAPGDTPLSLQQLAKYVALCLRWPAFIEDVVSFRISLEEVERLTGIRDLLKPYNDPEGLEQLIRFGLTPGLRTQEPGFSLAGISFQVLAAISPARIRSTDEPPPPPVVESNSIDFSNIPQSIRQPQQSISESRYSPQQEPPSSSKFSSFSEAPSKSAPPPSPPRRPITAPTKK